MLLELADDDLRQVALFHIGKRGVVESHKATRRRTAATENARRDLEGPVRNVVKL